MKNLCVLLILASLVFWAATMVALEKKTETLDVAAEKGCQPAVPALDANLEVTGLIDLAYPETQLLFKQVESTDFPTRYHLIIIGRMMRGIVKVKTKANGWWECGKLYTDLDQIEEKALEYAYTIVYASYEYSTDKRTLNPWGLAGTIKNESKFDRCAMGLHPREKAYQLGILKKNKRTLSHTEEDILKAVTHTKMIRSFSITGYDLGAAQLLSRFYIDAKNYKYMLSLKGGIIEGAREMSERARRHRTNRPWATWPGKRTPWYDAKVTKWARSLGARRDEI